MLPLGVWSGLGCSTQGQPALGDIEKAFSTATCETRSSDYLQTFVVVECSSPSGELVATIFQLAVVEERDTAAAYFDQIYFSGRGSDMGYLAPLCGPPIADGEALHVLGDSWFSGPVAQGDALAKAVGGEAFTLAKLCEASINPFEIGRAHV